MNKGDIVLVPFPFTNLKGLKRRPAIILYSGEKDAIVAFITSKVEAEKEFDVFVSPSAENGLKQISLIKVSKLATLDYELILGKIGVLEERKLRKVDEQIRLMLDL